MNNEQASITMPKEAFDQLMDRLDRLEKMQQTEMAAPMFGGAGLPAPYTQPAKKDSGWATAGKVAVGMLTVAALWGITAACGGGKSGGGNDNIFGGSNPM